MSNLTGPRFKFQSFRSSNERYLLRFEIFEAKCLHYKLTYYLDNNGYCGLIYSILLCFYLVKKINTDNMRLKFFFTISWKNQVFYVLFLNLQKLFILIKDLFYHSFQNAAELLILYKRMIVLDPKIVNLL